MREASSFAFLIRNERKRKILFFASLLLNIGCIPDANLVNWYVFFTTELSKKLKTVFFYQFKTRKIFLSKKNETVESSSPFSTYQKNPFQNIMNNDTTFCPF